MRQRSSLTSMTANRKLKREGNEEWKSFLGVEKKHYGRDWKRSDKSDDVAYSRPTSTCLWIGAFSSLSLGHSFRLLSEPRVQLLSPLVVLLTACYLIGYLQWTNEPMLHATSIHQHDPQHATRTKRYAIIFDRTWIIPKHLTLYVMQPSWTRWLSLLSRMKYTTGLEIFQ